MKLFILIVSNGDGSYSNIYSLDENRIAEFDNMYFDDKSLLELEFVPGIDKDGFHYDTLEVSHDSTYESLGISKKSILEPLESYLP